ncbi:MAG: ATP-binding protein [Burkholderiales bacterium]|nr:ATP-binding protein [Burkholderiales bacterium]
MNPAVVPPVARSRARVLALAALAVLVLVLAPALLEQAAAPAAALREASAAVGETVDDERLRATALPHRWRDDCAACTTLWYRIDRPLADPPREAQAVYLPALADNAAVYLNGRLLGQGGRFADPVARLGARPLWVSAPAALWQPGENRLYVLLKAERARFGLMPALAIGAESELIGAWHVRHSLAVTLPQVAATAAAMLALMMGVLAWYRRAEPGHHRLALAALLFSADTFARLVVEPPLSGTAWSGVLALLRLCLAASVAALVWRLGTVDTTEDSTVGAAVPAPKARRPGIMAAALAAFAAVAAAAAAQPSGVALEAVETAARLAWAAAGLGLLRQGWRAADARRAAPGAALAMAATVDLLRLPPLALAHPGAAIAPIVSAAASAEALPLAPWAVVALLGVAAWWLLVRFVETLNAAELLNIDLEAMVRERTAALQAQFERVRELERRETIAAERERLMRDMHDGVGGHLVSMLAMIEADRRRPGELAQVVREALDDMRLMIDSLEPVDDDLNAVLAMFHDRLAPRLRAAGVVLHWNVELLPQVSGLTPARVLHLLRMLQEAVTNAMRHGRARALWIAAAAGEGGGVRVEVRDDGAGFDPQAVQATGGGRGLKNLARRAHEIGAELSITSAPGCGANVVVRWTEP